MWGEVVPLSLNRNILYSLGSSGHMHSRIHEVDKFNDVDILFLGASRAYRSFDTRIYAKHDLKTFNLGSSSQTPLQTNILLSRYLKELNPKLIIYAVSPDIFISDGVESAVDLIACDKNDVSTLEMIAATKSIKALNTAIYGFYRDLFSRNKNFVEKPIIDGDLYVSGGFVERELKYYSLLNNKEQISENTIFREYQVEEFEKTIEAIKQRSIKLVLIQTPLVKNAYVKNKAFENIIDKHAPYYDFNEKLKLNDTVHFYDAYHLNQQGVVLFNESVIKQLGLTEMKK